MTSHLLHQSIHLSRPLPTAVLLLLSQEKLKNFLTIELKPVAIDRDRPVSMSQAPDDKHDSLHRPRQ